MSKQYTADVLIAGSGPIGCTFARELVEAGFKVIVCDAGPIQSIPPGAHLKNTYRYQRDVNSFTHVIRGHLQTLSVPTGSTFNPTLDASSVHKIGTIRFNQNPHQIPQENLSGEAVTYCVGGMATHWTCATPRLEGNERINPNLISYEEMNKLYEEAEKLLKTKKKPFEGTMLQETIKDALVSHYRNWEGSRELGHLPLALEIQGKSIVWVGSSDILGENCRENINYELKAEHLVEKLVYDENQTCIRYAEVKDLQKDESIQIAAKVFILACGAILTPQLLYNSKLKLPALGQYMCEQVVAFCQVVMKKSLLDGMLKDPRWEEGINKHRIKYPTDPIPIPFEVPQPQCWVPYDDETPWHRQIQREAFSYGDTPPAVDDRMIIDFRWFGIVKPNKENCVTFGSPSKPGTYDKNKDSVKDVYGMPQPTFHFKVSDDDAEVHHRMMEDMTQAALSIGGFLPGSYPQFIENGLALHVTGTTRMGDGEETSVVDINSKVHGVENLFLGGNGVIPTGIAANPTLTSCALALKASGFIKEYLKQNK